MNKLVVKNSIRFILLVLLQVLVLDNISFGGFIVPYVYVLFILLLPFEINKSLLLLLAFVTGLTIDFFGNTLGLHTAALVFLAFARPGVLHFYFPRLETNPNDEPGITKLGFGGFLKYSFSLIVLHQFILTFLEIFSLKHFFSSLLQVVMNAAATTLVILVIELFFSKRNRRAVRS